jgi:hypothetical protein
MKITAILEALVDRPWFIVYRVEPDEDGKTNKLPTYPGTLRNIDAQDSFNWMRPADAQAWVDHLNAQPLPPGILGWGVGVVIHEGSGLFCVDLDHCRMDNGGWMPHVLSFESRFSNAYRETSFSKTARHILGMHNGSIPAHGTRNRVYGMEAYTKRRFIALTGMDAEGSILADCTKALTAFLTEFFPEHCDTDHGTTWTTAPVAAWKGPADDDELIERAMRSASPKALFGGRAAFGDLFEARAEVLGRVFPTKSSHSAWNMSDADQSLANHLAFWTGSDCERMQRLMLRSKLVRDKWQRPDYLPRTILKATATQGEWYEEKTTSTPVREEVPAQVLPSAGVPAPPSVPPPPVVVADDWKDTDGMPKAGTILSVLDTKHFFSKFCYVRDINSIQLPDGSVANKERFDAMLGGAMYALSYDGQASDSAWKAYTLSQIDRYPRADTQYFKPGEATGVIRTREGRREVNSYQPIEVRRVSGDPAPFLDLVHKMLPNGDDAWILLCYMAACVQNLGKKFTWWPFIQGTKGNGKTTIGRVLEYGMTYRYTHWAKADQLGEKFNSFLFGKTLVVIDEMYNDDKREFEEILKQLVTAERLEVRPMYGEKMMREMVFNGLLFSNYQNGVRIDTDERRYAPLFCAQQTKSDKARDGLTKPYFIALNRWLRADGMAIVYDHLMELVIPDALNPATECIEAPLTTSTELAATASLGGVEQELVEAIKQQADGFRDGWISSQAVDILLARVGKDRAIPRNARKTLVTALGYIPHPSLGTDGMLPIATPDGNKPRLYIQKGHAWAVDYLSPEQVRQGYLEAQKKV